MTADPTPEITPQTTEGQPAQGCLLTALLVGMAIWITITSALAQLAQWLVEQGLFEGSLAIPDIRWVIPLAYAVALLVPLGVILAMFRDRQENKVFFGWLVAAQLPLFTFPARLLDVPEAHGMAALHIAGLGLYLVLVWALSQRRTPGLIRAGLRSPKPGVFLAVVVAALMAIPWLLWGAPGSPLDILLNLLVAGLFGVAAALVLQLGVFGSQPEAGSHSGRRLVADGFGAAFTLAILVTALGVPGMQWLLPPLLITLGWAAAAINRFSRQAVPEDPPHWPAQAWLFALSLAAPLVWVDPDELMLVVSGTEGDLLLWASRATLAGFLLALLADVVLLVIFKRLEGAQPAGRLRVAAAALTGALALAVFFIFGQPGFFGERLFVVLTDQADVGAAAEIEEIDTRRAFVYQTLVDHAETTQAGLRQALDRFGIDYTPYYLVNALEVDGGPLIRLWLSSRPEVDRVLISPRLRPLPEDLPASRGSALPPDGVPWNIHMVGADLVWDELGVDGTGIVIGQSDSGVQGDHPELAGSYLGRDAGDQYAWLDPWFGTESPTDYGGHGTHTLGSVLGQNTGVAPGAEWIGCVNLARNLGNPALYLDCMQFMLAPFPQDGDPFRDGDPARAADVLNNSWGCPEVEGCDPLTFLPAVKALRAAGIFVAVSAGNSGYSGCGSVESPPAIYDEVFTVGAVSPDGALAEFSSLGPVTVDGSQRVKPDILAPGDQVLSAFPGSTYQIASGTSMAGPHVAGVVALIWSANPDLVGDIEQTEAILTASARPMEGPLPSCGGGSDFPLNGVGYGLVDALEAVRTAQNARSP